METQWKLGDCNCSRLRMSSTRKLPRNTKKKFQKMGVELHEIIRQKTYHFHHKCKDYAYLIIP